MGDPGASQGLQCPHHADAIATPSRRRGRPALSHDNGRVRDALSAYATLSEMLEAEPAMADILAAVAMAQTSGQASNRPLRRRCIGVVLMTCRAISTQATATALGWKGYSRATIARYTAAARTASVHIERWLAQRSLGLT